jgi:hypothetical protein
VRASVCDHDASCPRRLALPSPCPLTTAIAATPTTHCVRLRLALKAAPNEQTPQRSVAEPCTLLWHPCSLLRVPGAPVSNSPMVAPHGRVLQRHESCLGRRRFFSRALVVCKQPSMFTLTVLFPRRPPCFTDHLIQRSSIRPLPLRLLLKDHVPSYRIPVSWFFEGIPAGSLSVTPLVV